MTVRLEVMPAGAWAGEVASRLLAALDANRGMRLVLPTGDTPSPVYAELAARAADRFGEAVVLGLDEWVGLPAHDPARCDGRLRRELLDRLVAPPAFREIAVDAFPSPDRAAREHDVHAQAGLDLVVLGLGGNGHVGFNEPGSTPTSPTRVVRLAEATLDASVERYGATLRPSGGITLGMDRILAAGAVWLLATGSRKAAILARALHAPESPECPASFLRRHPALTVFADEPAAVRLGVSG